MAKVRKAVIPAAGMGTRFLPATKAIAKEMLPIVNKPSIQLIVEEAAASGIEEVIVITGRGKTEIVDHFDAHPQLEETLRRAGKEALLREVILPSQMVKIATARQQRPLGLGHAILCARHLVGDEPFAVFLPDDLVDAVRPCARQLIDVFESTGKSVVALMNVPREETSAYGIAAGTLDAKDPRIVHVHTMVEKPPVDDAPSTLAIVGRYVLDPSVFSYLTRTNPGRGDEIQLTDALAAMMVERGLCGYLFEGNRFDAGDVTGYLLANLNWARRVPRIWAAIEQYVAAHPGSSRR
ncbi:MAG: UTP--glucose-1-phosphate uridylyltransferase GalU [Deltaproteobacteria bacterium]|nr:UTP--glucose-1-phosphate uridylyltransferase GalU [Deltaproteobacteria bacterium]